MKLLCFVVLVFTGGTLATVQPKSVNLALETVLQFDKKNHVADLEVITSVQKFLDNIKDVMSVYNDSRQSRRSNHESLKFTDFILEVVNIVRSYNDSDLKQVITVLDDESRKYNYKGSKFYELLDNRSLRRFMSRNLEDAKEIPLEKLRNLLDVVATCIKDQKFKRDEKKLLNLVNSLYSGSEKRFTQVLSNLNNYGTRRFSERPNLRDIVSKGLKTVIFDFYSKLNPNARMSLKSAVHNYWRYYLGGKDRPSNVASAKRREKPRSKNIYFVDITRYNNYDMHKWSARANRTKYILMTTSSLRMNKSLNKKANSHKRDSLGLSVDFNSLKPVFQSFLKSIALSSENKKKGSADIIPIKENKTKTKHKNVKHSKQEALKSFIQAMPMPDSFEASQGDAGHEKSRTVMIPYVEYQGTSSKKKRGRTSRNKEQISLDNFLKSKSEIRSEIRDLNEIQKKYDKLRKIQSNLSPEVNSDKEDKEEEEDMSGLEFLVGGQKIQDIQHSQPKLTKRIDSKKNQESENEANIVSDHQAVIEVTESKDLMSKKRLRTTRKTAKERKKHRKPHKTQTSMLNLRSAKKKTLRESSSKPAHTSNEGMSIESYKNENINTHSAIRRIEEGESESVTENLNLQSTTDSNVVSILHKLEKELENVKAKIKYDATLNTNKAGVTSQSHSIESIADTVSTRDTIPFWSGTAKTKSIKATTLKVVSQEKRNGRRDRFRKHGSKYLEDPLFESNNITYNSKLISPLQVLLNQTMERISSYINKTIGTNQNKYNAKDIYFDKSDDLSKSNERIESVTKTVTKVSKTTQELLEKNKRKSKENPKIGPQSLEEGERKTLSKEKVRKGFQYFEEGEKRPLSKEKVYNRTKSVEGEIKTLYKEKVSKETQSLEDKEKKTLSKEKMFQRTQSVEGEIKTLSKEKVFKRTQSLEGEKKTQSKEKVSKKPRSFEDVEKKTASKENVKYRSQSLEKREKITVSKEKVENASQFLEEREKSTVSIDMVIKETQSLKQIEKRTMPKENAGKGSQSLEEGKHRTVPEEKVKESSPEVEKLTGSKKKVEKGQSSETDKKGTVSKENISEGTLILLKDKNDTKSHDNELEPDGSKTATTPTVENVSLSTPTMNDVINKTRNEYAGKFIEPVKNESRSNTSGMISVDPALNDLLDDDSKGTGY